MIHKLSNMRYLIILCLLSAHAMGIRATTATHWMVTETGLIKPKMDSPFQMTNPHDLLAFLNQDTRWNNIINLYHDLSKRQYILDKQWEDIESGSYVKTTDVHCVKTGILNTLDWYYADLEDGSSKDIPEEEYMMVVPSYDEEINVPDCKKISSLTFSMFAFEHLNSSMGRENLKFEREKNLPERISSLMSVEQFGHWLATVLRKNSSSWLHYNMASLYWRVKGNAPKAMECSRRAVHYAPRYYKDIALLNMGIILHRSKKTEDAITVLSAAVEHDSNFYSSHFILANALAVYGDFNNSLKHYDRCLSLNPKYTKGEKYKQEMLCCASMLQNILSAKETVISLRKNLKDYLQRESYWLKSQAAFLKVMRHETEHDYRNVDKNCEKMTELTGLNLKGLKKEGEKFSLIHYFLESPMYNNKWISEKGVHILESAFSLQKLVKHIQKNSKKTPEFVISKDFKITDGTITEEFGPMPLFVDIEVAIDETKEEIEKPTTKQFDDDMSEYETGVVLYPTTMKVNRNREDFDTNQEWPTVKFCKEYSSINLDKVEGIYPIFLPFENKGVRMRAMLTDKIGVPATKEHDLPWHPPACTKSKETPHAQKKPSKIPLLNDVIATDYLNRKLLEYVSDGDTESVEHMQEAEIGQRIYSAMQMGVAPQWILYTLSSLYWRVRGNNNNALNCLLHAAKVVNNQYKDLVLVSIASVYLEMGFFYESLGAAEDAFKLNMYEPATNFILAELNMIKKHRNTQLFHLKQVVRVEPGFMDGLGRKLLNSWACIHDFTRHANVLKEMGNDINSIEKDVCGSAEKNLNVVCENEGGGVNCKTTNIQCFSGNERGMTAVVKTLQHKVADDDLIYENIFSVIISNMPTQRSDKAGHDLNYEDLMRIVDDAMKGCGPQGCRSMTAEGLGLKQSDCTMQYMQLGYWLHVVGFRQILEDPNIRLPLEVSTVTPSNARKVPECRLFTDPSADYFLDRMMRVDTEGWEPDLSLMHQYTEIYEYTDYVTHGAKLAKYLSDRPQSWRVLLSAGWWCGVGGRGACAVRCLAAAYSLAPKQYAMYVPRALATLLNMHSKLQDAKDMAYLAFYLSPKSKLGAFIAAISHSFLNEYDQAVWMYRYTMKFESQYLPAKACLHATLCHMIYPEIANDEG